jgi:hypothetical protein
MPNSKHLTHGISNLVSLITKTKLGLSHRHLHIEAKERLRRPHHKDEALPALDSNGKSPYLSEDAGEKRLRDEEEAGKPYSATTTTSSPRRRRPDTHITEDHPPARPGSTTNDGEQTLAPPPDLDDEQTQELGPNPTIYTSARRFADLPSSTMPWLPPEGRKAGEIAAGNAIHPLFTFCNCSRGEEAKSREAVLLCRASLRLRLVHEKKTFRCHIGCMRRTSGDVFGY